MVPPPRVTTQKIAKQHKNEPNIIQVSYRTELPQRSRLPPKRSRSVINRPALPDGTSSVSQGHLHPQPKSRPSP
ncbi:hypothetical protein VTH06DRAFT_1164 [Thermothelomyces fergusii]